MAKHESQEKHNQPKAKQQKQNMKKQKQRKQQPVKRGNTAIGLLVIALLVYICCITNLSGAAYGGNAKFGNLCITIVFILFWSVFPVLYKNNTVLIKVSFVINFLLLFAAATGLVLRLLDDGGFLSAALVSIAAVPFYGLRIVLGWTGTYVVATVITFWWMLYSSAVLGQLRPKK